MGGGGDQGNESPEEELHKAVHVIEVDGVAHHLDIWETNSGVLIEIGEIFVKTGIFRNMFRAHRERGANTKEKIKPIPLLTILVYVVKHSSERGRVCDFDIAVAMLIDVFAVDVEVVWVDARLHQGGPLRGGERERNIRH